RLSCHSPAVDAGDLSVVMDLGLMLDFDGLPRVHNGVPDMGAFEWQGLAAEINEVDVSCNQFSDGNIHVEVSEGTSPYEYEWNTGVSTPSLSNLPAGQYNLT